MNLNREGASSAANCQGTQGTICCLAFSCFKTPGPRQQVGTTPYKNELLARVVRVYTYYRSCTVGMRTSVVQRKRLLQHVGIAPPGFWDQAIRQPYRYFNGMTSPLCGNPDECYGEGSPFFLLRFLKLRRTIYHATRVFCANGTSISTRSSMTLAHKTCRKKKPDI